MQFFMVWHERKKKYTFKFSHPVFFGHFKAHTKFVVIFHYILLTHFLDPMSQWPILYLFGQKLLELFPYKSEKYQIRLFNKYLGFVICNFKKTFFCKWYALIVYEWFFFNQPLEFELQVKLVQKWLSVNLAEQKKSLHGFWTEFRKSGHSE